MPKMLSMALSDITAIIVNYCTYDLTRMALWSLYGHYPGLSIRIIDNGSTDGSGGRLENLVRGFHRVEVIRNDRNEHHGPAMHQLAKEVTTDYFLTFDSDAILYRPGLLEEFLNIMRSQKVYAVGHQMLMDPYGFKTTQPTGIPYVHPFCALFHTATYQQLPPFEKHGAPCLRNERAAQEQGWPLEAFPVKAYVYHPWQGTVSRTGHQLGWRSKWNQLLHKLGR